MSTKIDALIAIHLFGYKILYDVPSGYGEVGGVGIIRPDTDYSKSIVPYDWGESLEWVFIPAYSINIQNAWLVVEKIRDDNEKIHINIIAVSDKNTSLRTWICGIEDNVEQHESAPMAICLAALKALGIKNE